MKNQWKQGQLDLNNIAALNGTRTVSGFNSVPSDFDQVSYLRQLSINFDTGFVFSGGGSDSGFTEYSAIIYRQFVNFVGANWDYSDSFYDALGLDKFQFEQLLIENGSLAIIKTAAGYFVFGYTAVDFDIYNRPTKIRIISPNSKIWNNKEFSKDFIIIDNDPTKWNVIVKNLSWLQLSYKVACALYDNIYEGQIHYLKLNIPSVDPEGSSGALLLDDALKERTSIISYTSKEAASSYSAKANEGARGGSAFDQWQQSILPLEFRDRLDTLWETYQNALQEVYKDLGIRINLNNKKRERQITGEIDVQQELPLAQKRAMFQKRGSALQRANSLWGTDWSITETPTQEEKQEEAENE